MLAEANRLTLKKDFAKVFKEGRASFDGNLGIKILENSLDQTRFGFLVGQKVSKKAVARNKVKRRLRAIVRQKLPQIKKGYDVVVITLPPIASQKYKNIERSVSHNLKKLQLI